MNEVDSAAAPAESGDGGPIILQFWDRDIPTSVAELVDSIRDANPAMPHRLYDDSAAADFIREEFGAEALRAYMDCALPAMRADLFRYCFLVRHGGLYVDADYRALRPVDELIAGGPRGFLYQRPKGLTNSVMFFRGANDPFAIRILEKALERIARRDSDSVWATTGPGVMRALHGNAAQTELFEGFRLVREDELLTYFEPFDNLEYKSGDQHWTVAREKGISIFTEQGGG